MSTKTARKLKAASRLRKSPGRPVQSAPGSKAGTGSGTKPESGFHLFNGPDIPALGHTLAPPLVPKLFGPPKFTADQQAANPNSPMTRVIKDVLPVGRWKAGISNDGKSFRMFEVTPELLTEIRDNFSLAQSRGAAFNLGKSHGDPVTGLIPTDELIAPIDQIETDGNTLWAACYVTPSQAAFLSNPVCKVSAGVRQNWFDGQANPYSYQLVHIAVTDLPAVTGQGRFLTMSNTLSATTDPEETDAGEAMGGDSEVLSSSTKELWNRALSLLGLGVLADDVDEDNLETVVSALLNTLSQSSNDSADSADSNSDGAKTLPPLNPAVGANMTAELSNATPATPATQINLANSAVATPATPADPFAAILTAIKEQGAQIINLSNTVASLQGVQAVTAETKYMDRLNDLAGKGKITGALVAGLTEVGKVTGWNLSNLDGFDGVQMINLANQSQALATAAAPEINGKGVELTPEQKREHFKSLFGRYPGATK